MTSRSKTDKNNIDGEDAMPVWLQINGPNYKTSSAHKTGTRGDTMEQDIKQTSYEKLKAIISSKEIIIESLKLCGICNNWRRLCYVELENDKMMERWHTCEKWQLLKPR